MYKARLWPLRANAKTAHNGNKRPSSNNKRKRFSQGVERNKCSNLSWRSLRLPHRNFAVSFSARKRLKISNLKERQWNNELLILFFKIISLLPVRISSACYLRRSFIAIISGLSICSKVPEASLIQTNYKRKFDYFYFFLFKK